jgi:copper chaperone CopZ
MRALLSILLLVLLSVPAYACDKCGAKAEKDPNRSARERSNRADHKKNQVATGKVYRISVPDLVDGGCIDKIAGKLETIDGVVSVEGDGRDKTLTVTMVEGKELSEADAKQAVESVKHSFGGIKEIGGPDRARPVDEAGAPAK